MKKTYYSFYFVMPLLLIFTLLFLVPSIIGMGAAFTDWHALNRTGIHIIGLEHIRYALFDDPNTKLAFRNTFIYAFFVMVIQNLFGLGLALMMNMSFRSSGYIRSAFFSPVVFSSLIIAYTFSAILYPEGPVDQLLKVFGMEFLIKSWLIDKTINIYIISSIHVWWWMGFSAVIYLAGLKSIPFELREASKIDGATKLQNFRNITFPLIGPAVTVNMISAFIGTMKAFDLPYLMAGTSNAPTIMGMVIQNMSQGQKAYGTAINLILVAVILIIALPMIAYFKKREVEL
ncbi:MAG TPA: sugar ABC transporter permease [Bacilli bacterium]